MPAKKSKTKSKVSRKAAPKSKAKKENFHDGGFLMVSIIAAGGLLSTIALVVAY